MSPTMAVRSDTIEVDKETIWAVIEPDSAPFVSIPGGGALSLNTRKATRETNATMKSVKTSFLDTAGLSLIA
jgi:hypothetical protein